MVTLQMVVVNYRTPEFLKAYCESLLEHPPSVDYELTIVDVDPDPADPSPPPYGRYLSSTKNIGYARACNVAGASATPSEYLAFFNADTRFTNNDCIDRCVEFLDQHPEVGIVGPLQLNCYGTVTHGGVFGSRKQPRERDFGKRMSSKLKRDEQAVTVSGSAIFVKRHVWDGLTACPIFRSEFPDAEGAFLPTQHYYEETGMVYHAYAHGYETWYLGSASMEHEWHGSSKPGSMLRHMPESRKTFRHFCDAHGIERP